MYYVTWLVDQAQEISKFCRNLCHDPSLKQNNVKVNPFALELPVSTHVDPRPFYPLWHHQFSKCPAREKKIEARKAKKEGRRESEK